MRTCKSVTDLCRKLPINTNEASILPIRTTSLPRVYVRGVRGRFVSREKTIVGRVAGSLASAYARQADFSRCSFLPDVTISLIIITSERETTAEKARCASARGTEKRALTA